MGEDFSDLSRLDDARLAEMFQQKRDDQAFLEALNEVLKHRDSDEATDLHLEVAEARRAFAKPAPPRQMVESPRQSGPVRDWLRAFLGARSLTAPDRRPLYRYRMSDGEYDQAKTILRGLARSGRLANPDQRAGALFVSFCAEWFRRESTSTFLRWDSLAPDLFPAVPYASKQDLTLFGLRYWRRDLRRSASAREFLLTLALEGGFPVRILTEGAGGWLKDYLRSIMRRAISWREESGSELLAIAEEERGRMRKSYQHDDFVALCSELVESLLDLRRKAEAENANGIRNSTLLDARHPGWREELPIYVPSEDEALVTELLTGLIDQKMIGLSTVGVETRRYLVKRAGQWLPAVQLLADGEVPSSKLAGLPRHGRVRAIPTGELANYLTGDLALLEAPMGEQRHWRVRPFMRIAKLLTGFRFALPVTTALTSLQGSPFPWTWPRGEGLRSDVLVFQQDEGSTPEEPLLRFLRAGSVSSPAKALYALIPDDWAIEAAAEDAVVEIEEVPSLGCKLVRLAGAAYFRAGEAESTPFRVEPDTEARERELELGGLSDPGFALAEEQWEPIVTPVRPMIRESGKHLLRTPIINELFIRRPGGRWSPLNGALDQAGLMELSWRDPVANVQIERRLLVLIPSGAHVSGTMQDGLRGEIRLEGLPGWSASIHERSCSVENVDNSILSIRFNSRPIHRLPLTLHPPVGPSIRIIVPLIGRDAVVALADGSILQQGAQVDIGALRGAVAVAPRRTLAHLAAKGARSGGLNVIVDGELPLGILRSAIDETLATLSGQDDLVELDFIGDTRRPIRISRYRYDQLAVESGAVTRTPQDASNALPVARMILDPRHEHALEKTEDGLWHIPERCSGLCLVYLRDGIDVVSRPVPVQRPGASVGYAGDLVSALLIADFKERQHEIEKALLGWGVGGGTTEDLSWLIDAATNLNGLPATVFDALKMLPACPAALLRLLFNARDAGERGAIWSLQNELPFLWLAMPLSAWQTALQVDYLAVATALEPIFGRERAYEEAAARLSNLRDELIALEPALDAVFSLSGMSSTQAASLPTLRDLTSGYVASQFDRGGEAPNEIGSHFTSRGMKLPVEIETKSHEDFAGLFAPVFLAASARERLVLDREQALLARRVLREDPLYVSASWCQLLKYYA